MSWQIKPDSALQNAFSHKRGPELKHNRLTIENEKLLRQNQRLQEELLKAEIVIERKNSCHAVWSAIVACSGRR